MPKGREPTPEKIALGDKLFNDKRLSRRRHRLVRDLPRPEEGLHRPQAPTSEGVRKTERAAQQPDHPERDVQRDPVLGRARGHARGPGEAADPEPDRDGPEDARGRGDEGARDPRVRERVPEGVRPPSELRRPRRTRSPPSSARSSRATRRSTASSRATRRRSTRRRSAAGRSSTARAAATRATPATRSRRSSATRSSTTSASPRTSRTSSQLAREGLRDRCAPATRSRSTSSRSRRSSRELGRFLVTKQRERHRRLQDARRCATSPSPRRTCTTARSRRSGT